MTRISATQFLNKLSTDDALQEEMVVLGASHGFEFTREQLADTKPGSTAEPLTWKNIAGLPDLDALPTSAGNHAAAPSRRGRWNNRTSLLAATSVLLYGSLGWYLWRRGRTAT